MEATTSPSEASFSGLNQAGLSLQELAVHFLEIDVKPGVFDGQGRLVRQKGQKTHIRFGDGFSRELVVHGQNADGLVLDDQGNDRKGAAPETLRMSGLTSGSLAASWMLKARFSRIALMRMERFSLKGMRILRGWIP